MAKITIKIPTFTITIEGDARDATEAWAMVRDYHLDEITDTAIAVGKIVKAVYDREDL